MFDADCRVEQIPIPVAGDCLDEFARRILAACRARLPDLSSHLIVLPSPALAPGLRQALAAAAGRPVLLPRIATLAQLAASAGNAGGQPDSQRQLALFRELRQRGWFADGALWEVCAELVALFDELSERDIGLPADESAFLERLERAYDIRASRHLHFEAEVVHRLWRAEASGPPGRQAAQAISLAQLAAAATTPLFLLSEGGLRPVEAAFCQAWAARQPVTVFQPQRDAAASPLMRVLNLAWPPGAGAAPPLVARAEARAGRLAGQPAGGTGCG
jgi:ATP-dependent helicase/nuclease subunit B